MSKLDNKNKSIDFDDFSSDYEKTLREFWKS